jgi:hypothetical protein
MPPKNRTLIEHGHDDHGAYKVLPNDALEPANHAAALETSRALCGTFTRMYPGVGIVIDPLDVLDALNQAGVRFVLMGAHGFGGWMQQARATRDVDVVVEKADHKKAVKAIGQRFGDLIIDEHVVVTRFLDPSTQESVVNLMRPVNLYQHVFANAVQVAGGHKVPNVEMAVASKFSAIVSRNRPEEKQYLDASDFIQIVKRNHKSIDRERLRTLGEAVYPDGGDALLKMVDDVVAGRRLRI